MTTVWLMRAGNGMPVPASRTDREAWDRLKGNGPFRAEITQPRNGKHHRLFFAELQTVFENQGRFDNIERLRAYSLVRAGYRDEWEFPAVAFDREFLFHLTRLARHLFFVEAGSGVKVMAPKSISYSELSEEEFSQLHERVRAVWLNDFGVDVEKVSEEA